MHPSWIQRLKNKITQDSYTSSADVEKAEYRFYIDYLKEGMTVMDVGANIGEISLLAAHFIGNTGRVHAFEASQSTFNRLSTIVEMSNVKTIDIHHIAVSEMSDQTVILHTYGEDRSGWNTLAKRPVHTRGAATLPTGEEKIKTISLDDFCIQNNINCIDLLKIDVEGAEYQVLKGAQKLLSAHRINCIVFEFGMTTYDMGNNPDEIQTLLTSVGYTIQNIVSGDPIFPGRKNRETARFSLQVARPKKLHSIQR